MGWKKLKMSICINETKTKSEMLYVHLLFCSFVPFLLSFRQRQPESLPHTQARRSDKTESAQFSHTRAQSKISRITTTIYWSRI